MTSSKNMYFLLPSPCVIVRHQDSTYPPSVQKMTSSWPTPPPPRYQPSFPCTYSVYEYQFFESEPKESIEYVLGSQRARIPSQESGKPSQQSGKPSQQVWLPSQGVWLGSQGVWPAIQKSWIGSQDSWIASQDSWIHSQKFKRVRLTGQAHWLQMLTD